MYACVRPRSVLSAVKKGKAVLYAPGRQESGRRRAGGGGGPSIASLSGGPLGPRRGRRARRVTDTVYVQLLVKVDTRTRAVPAATSPRPSPPTSLDLSDELNLDRHVARQRVGAHGGARVDASLAEDGAEQLGAAVEDLGLLRELGRAVDEADHLDDPLHAVEVAWFRQMAAASDLGISEARPARSLTLPWAEPLHAAEDTVHTLGCPARA